MNWLQLLYTYGVCWWLVLFMVLPHQADAPAEPGKGHSRGAPAKHQLGRKMRWTTVLAIVPAVIFYFIISSAYAADTVYRAGGGCKPLATYKPSADLNAKDGTGAGGKATKPATLEGGSTILGERDSYSIPLRIPAQNYVNPNATNADLSQSFVRMGELEVTKEGVTLDGVAATPQEVYPEGCAEGEQAPAGSDNILSTK